MFGCIIITVMQFEVFLCISLQYFCVYLLFHTTVASISFV